MGYALSGGRLAWGQGFHGSSWIVLTFKIKEKWNFFFYGSWPELELGKALKTTVGKSCRGQSKAAHCACAQGGSS